MTGYFLQIEEMNVTPSASSAFNVAESHISVQQIEFAGPELTKNMQFGGEKGELTIFPDPNKKDAYRLAYKFVVTCRSLFTEAMSSSMLKPTQCFEPRA